MKKRLFTIITILSCLYTFISCDNFIDETNPNKIPVESYFQTENDVERAVNAIYLAIRSNSCLGETSYLYTEERSDNMGRLDNQSSAGEPFQFTDFSLLPSNTYLRSHWNSLYTAITRSNFVLTYIDDVEFENETDKTNISAEAKFLRALVYFHLVRKWGDVPLVTKFLSTQDEIKEITFREKQETVYAQIIADLSDGMQSSLPNIQPASGKGRTCKAAISALLGQVYLTMATSQIGDENSNLNAAKQYLEEAYKMRTFGDLSEIPYSDVFNVEKKNSCPEIIFQIQYIQGDKDYSSVIATKNQPKGEYINSQKVSTGTGNFVNPDIVNEFEENDIRKEWSIQYSSYSNAYFITKFRDASDAAGTLGYGGNDWILMRYADVILMLAEVNQLLNNETDAIGYLNQVRNRAGLSSYEESIKDVQYKSNYPNLKLAILHERRLELAFENHRWFDLLRFFNTDELVTYIHAKKQEDYGISNIKNFGTKDRYYPIPFDENKLDPEKMYQNPGY
ncbi:MAG: RagB/SusD family nutrient uptake outer membrane protein [Massilibacteroides sp.]|nr:RagB/SusD family nutrient uptake outer membrane protein [Massilibacteroides sp.]MDD4115604.1 RagB/SusD family nutrient uptake outer membrane protein [Massilibacteroides sp.]MDD4660183.1 RagB/SusD family nutrient uptake outer membrane protein [Massilibacteroides sp.]